MQIRSFFGNLMYVKSYLCSLEFSKLTKYDTILNHISTTPHSKTG